MVQNALVSANATLIYSRILRRVADLDVFSEEMLRTDDEQVVGGALTFGSGLATMDEAWRIISRWTLLMLVCLMTVMVLILRLPASIFHSPEALAGLSLTLISILLLFGYFGSRDMTRMTPDRIAYLKAAKWLQKKRPVVIAASDLFPDDQVKLPENVVCFYKDTPTGPKQAARHDDCKYL